MTITVLVADDHPLVREGMMRALDRDPIMVIAEACTGEEAIERAGTARPDVIMLDLGMPGIGGLAVLEHLRDTDSSTRALVVTASEREETLLEAIAAGAAGYLTKRATPEEIRQAVITVAGGGSVISPSMAGYLLRQFSRRTIAGQSPSAPLLTTLEREVLRLIAQGHTDKEIGSVLFISARTVQNHLGRIREKTGTRRRSELARWAGEHAQV